MAVCIIHSTFWLSLVVRYCTLPVSHPLHKPVCICAHRRAKRHLSPIHILIHAYDVKPSEDEMLSMAVRPPNSKCAVVTDIAASREESKEADLADNATLQVYTDGSGQDGMAGATAVLFKGGNIIGTLCYHLGSLEQHTTFKAELVGISSAFGWSAGSRMQTRHL